MSDVTVPDDLPNPKNPGHRTKAARLRARVRAGAALSPEEVAWLGDYEAAQANGRTSLPGDVGGSVSSRSVHIEEHAAAVGTGSAAEVAAAAALAREEGRRIDYLANTGIKALSQACELYKAMTESLLARCMQMEDVHLGMLGAVREQYLARTQAEVEALQNEEGGEVNALLQVLVQRLAGGGMAAPTLPAPSRTPRGRKHR